MKKKSIIKVTFILLDIIIINAIFILSFYIRFFGSVPSFNFNSYLQTWYIMTFIFISIFYFLGIYNREEFSLYFFLDLFYAVGFSYLCIILFYYVFRELIGGFPSTVFLLSWFLNLFFLSIIRTIFLKIIFKKRILIVGKSKEAKKIPELIRKKQYIFMGFIDKNVKSADLLRKIREKKIRLVIFSEKMRSARVINPWVINPGVTTPGVANTGVFYDLLDKLTGLGIKILFDIKIMEPPITKTRVYELGGMIFYEFLWGQKKIFEIFLKRGFDIIGSLLLLILLSPLFLFIMLVIRLDSVGNIFFSQDRIGKGYKRFTIYKFRTMVRDAEQRTGPVWSDGEDKRITRAGRFLRRFGLDELPQLWLVLKGDMSFVGPRPEREYFIRKYPVLLGRRLSIPPGITGLAQVSSSRLNPAEKTRYDIAYVENQSFLLDLRIVQKTLIFIFRRLFFNE